MPLALAGGQPGSEIETAVVILSGLVTSTALDMRVVPALYLRFGSVRRGPTRAIEHAGERPPPHHVVKDS